MELILSVKTFNGCPSKFLMHIENADRTPAEKLILTLNDLRKSLLALGIGLASTTILFFYFAPEILQVLQDHLNQPLSFFLVTEPLLALIKLALISACMVLMPWILYCFWKAAAKPFGLSKKQTILFVFFTCLLFYAGVSFCYLITLPFGVNFLLGFQSEKLQPVISMGRFITFISMFLLAFGTIFQLPVFMVFVAKVGFYSRQSFEKNRRYALLIISILAALLTPTPDVVNMLLMGLPLYMLYELGIVVLRFMKL